MTSELPRLSRAATEGQTLKTVTGKRFTVGIYRDCPFFTPASSGYGQSDGRKGHRDASSRATTRPGACKPVTTRT